MKTGKHDRTGWMTGDAAEDPRIRVKVVLSTRNALEMAIECFGIWCATQVGTFWRTAMRIPPEILPGTHCLRHLCVQPRIVLFCLIDTYLEW